MVSSEPPLQGKIVLWLFVALFNAVVAGDHYLLRPDSSVGSFGLSFEWVVVCPLLEVVGANLLWSHFFDDDYILSMVAVPPNIVALDVSIRVLSANTAALASSTISIVPFVLKRVDAHLSLAHQGV